MPIQVPRVAILIETDSTWGRNIVRGIARYADGRATWHLLIDPRDHEHRPSLPEGWKGQGIIARIASQLQYEQLVGTGLPVVAVDDVFDCGPGVAKVNADCRSWARLAHEHLATRGFTSFGYFAPPSPSYNTRRRDSLKSVVEAAGHEFHEYRPGYRARRKLSWDEQQRRVGRWLESLPKPIAVVAVDAHNAHQFSEICHFAEVRVPDDVAILAGDVDDLLCEVSSPPLSSISMASERIGYQAAEILAKLMGGEPVLPEPTLVQPHDVVSRQSTDVLSIDDPIVVQALRYIQQHAHRGITVADIVREVPLSRRSLEIQFRSYLDRSPAEEIRRVMLIRGRMLLGHPDMSITEIGLAAGFPNATRFGIAFRKEFGVTPSQFRKSLLAK